MNTQYWEEEIEKQQISGKNMKDYCWEAGLSYDLFKSHKYSEQKKQWMAVQVEERKHQASTVRINGFDIEIQEDIEMGTLVKLLKAMKQC